MSNGANLAPHEIKILLAVLPVALCQGLFYHLYRKVTAKT